MELAAEVTVEVVVGGEGAKEEAVMEPTKHQKRNSGLCAGKGFRRGIPKNRSGH